MRRYIYFHCRERKRESKRDDYFNLISEIMEAKKLFERPAHFSRDKLKKNTL